jgi:photosystem II stability/assembly factor-like uncharacterized protein
MRRLLLIAVVCGATGTSSAADLSSWAFRHQGTYPTDFVDVEWSPSGERAVAVGSSGIAAWSHDGGVTWSEAPLQTSADATGVAWQGEDDVWVTGTHWVGWSGTGVLLHSADGGQTWETSVSDHPEPLTSIAFADPLTGFAGQPGDGLLVTRDGGSTWRVEDHTGDTLASVSFLDSMIGHAAGTGMNFTLYRTANGGTDWAPVYDCPDGTITGISFADGVHGFLASPVSVASSDDAGTTWSSPTAIPGTWIQDLVFADVQTGWVAGASQDGTDRSGIVLTTVDGSTSWSDTGPEEPDRITALAVNDSVVLLAAGEGGTLLMTSDGGSTWQDLAPAPANHLRSIYMDDPSAGWAVGPVGTVHRTTDGGSHWTSVGGLGTWTLESIVRADADTLYACGSYALIASDDDGVSWEMRYSYLNCHTLWFFSEQQGLAGTQYGVFWTEDGGLTWAMANDGGIGTGGVFDLHFFDASHGFAAAGIGRILETVDGGRNWTTVHTEPPGFNSYLRGIDFASPTHGAVVGMDGVILTTSDGGSTWQHQTSGTTFHLNDVRYLEPAVLLAVGDDGVVLSSIDGGVSWQAQASSTTTDLWEISLIDPSAPMIVGDWGVVLAPGAPSLIFADGFESGGLGAWSTTTGGTIR